MYAVIQYFNYRKDVSFGIIKTFNNLNKAKKFAFNYAKEEFGDDCTIVISVSDRWVYADDEIFEGYTVGDGYGQFVFTVIEIEMPTDDDEDDDEDNSDNDSDDDSKSIYEETNNGDLLKIIKKNGKYDWGFDLINFKNEKDFQKLLNIFNMKLDENHDKYFKWENEDSSILMITSNNPIVESGYVGFVGISCTTNTNKTYIS